MNPSIKFIMALVALAGIVIVLSTPSYAADNTAYGVGALKSGTTKGVDDSAFGYDALYHTTTGVANTATGVNALLANITGSYNTADGVGALTANTGSDNTAAGFQALYYNATGSFDVANGYQALFSNTNGSFNTATGGDALYSNTSGYDNTAVGGYALYGNTIGYEATALGEGALYSNINGSENTATGIAALYFNTSGSDNTADGGFALYDNTTGGGNTADGGFALYDNTTGGANTADGYDALYNATGSYNTALGNSAGFNINSGTNNIDIANAGTFNDDGIIRIGDGQAQTFIAGIENATVSGGAAVYVLTNGQLGIEKSSRLYKQDIKEMGDSSDVLLSLKPVSFKYKPQIDPKGLPQYGLVAEDVEKACPALVVHEKDGKPYTVRYEAVNAMLLNEFLKQHRKMQDQQTDIAVLQSAVAQQQHEISNLTASLKDQASLLQKVSAQMQVIRCAPQVVSNN
jgi:hypothetical protein